LSSLSQPFKQLNSVHSVGLQAAFPSFQPLSENPSLGENGEHIGMLCGTGIRTANVSDDIATSVAIFVFKILLKIMMRVRTHHHYV